MHTPLRGTSLLCPSLPGKAIVVFQLLSFSVCSMPGYPVLHHFLGLAHQVGDVKAIKLFFSMSPKTLVSKIQFGTSAERFRFWHQNCDVNKKYVFGLPPFLGTELLKRLEIPECRGERRSS